MRIILAALGGGALVLGAAARASSSDFDQERLFAQGMNSDDGWSAPRPPVAAWLEPRLQAVDAEGWPRLPAQAGPPAWESRLQAMDEDLLPYSWQVLPPGLMYKSYLAGVREPRFSTAMLYEKRRGWVWDNTLGGRVGVLRYGSQGTVRPQGFQLDMEGAAIARLDVENRDDLEAVDFRFGTPFTWRDGPLSVKFGYYHVSSHVGDEFLLRNPDHHRLNYVRDALIFGISLDVTPDTRTYAETAWAFKASDGARPWEFQFGSEYSPAQPAGSRAVPYAAVNGHLRQEHSFGGDLSLMAGWQWRGELTDRLWRFGFQYYNGKSIQYSFFDQNERLTGVGLWFDY